MQERMKSESELMEELRKEEDPVKAKKLYDILKETHFEIISKINDRVNQNQNQIQQLHDQIRQLTSDIGLLTQKKKQIQKAESECKILLEKKNSGKNFSSGNIFRKNDFMKWSTGDVVAWLGTLEGGKFVKYSKNFSESDVHGKLLNDLTREDLQVIGVKNLSDNRQLFDAITSLRDTPSQPLINPGVRHLPPGSPPTAPPPVFSFVVPGTGSAEKIHFRAQQDHHRYLFVPVPSVSSTMVDVLLSNSRTLVFQSSGTSSGTSEGRTGPSGTSEGRTVPSGISEGRTVPSGTSADVSRSRSDLSGVRPVPFVQMFTLPFDVSQTDLTLDGTTVVLHYEHLVQLPPMTLITPGSTSVPAETSGGVLSYVIPSVHGGDKPEIRPRLDDHRYIFEAVPGGTDAMVTVELPDPRTVLFRVRYKEEGEEEEKHVVHVFSLAFDVTESLFGIEGTDVVLVVPG